MADYSFINLYVYNTSFQKIAFIDAYSSLIWNDRFDEPGEFELTLLYEEKWLNLFQKDYYVKIDFSDRMCIIEKIETKKEAEQAPIMIISGRSIESILERRVVLSKKEYEGANLQGSIIELLNENVIYPDNNNRKIPGFVVNVNNSEKITSIVFTENYNGNDLLSVVKNVCKDKHIGFKILSDDSNHFVFQLYAGTDRSKANNASRYVVFSPFFDNLQNSDYSTSNELYRNFMIVSKDENNFLTAFSTSTEPTGLDRREIHEDATSLKENEDTELTDTQIVVKAVKKLKIDYKIKTSFDGDIVPEQMYKYRTHYNVGDRVHFEDGYGNDKDVYISEVVISMDENGLTIIPTFSDIDWE